MAAASPSFSLIESWVLSAIPGIAARYDGAEPEWREARFRAMWGSDGPADIPGYFVALARRAEVVAELEAEALAEAEAAAERRAAPVQFNLFE